jgi:hypothetical protein
MALKATQSRIYVDRFDFSSVTSGYDLRATVGEGEATVLTSDGLDYDPLLPMVELLHRGYVTTVGAAGAFEKEAYDRLGLGSSLVGLEVDTEIVASPVWMLPGTQNKDMKFAFPAANVMTFEGTWGFSPSGKRGWRVAKGLIAATGTQTPVDFGAAGVNGGDAFLWVQAITGTATNAAFKIQHATTSGGTYTDLGTFTVSSVGAFQLSFAGGVNRWIRFSTTGMGGATGFTLMAAVGVNGITQ